jgi:hypothetical protein
MKYLAIGLALLGACASSLPGPTDPLDVRVESWELIDVGPMNARIEDAVAQGHAWPRNSLMVALEFVGGDGEQRYLSLRKWGNRGEISDTMVVVMARDCFQDDSVRGDWHRIVLYRFEDMTWRVAEARRAFRCWRVKNLDVYAAELCL